MTQHPFTPMFDAQRTAIEQTHALTTDVVEAQRRSFGAVADLVDASGSMSETNAAFTMGMLHASLDAIEGAMPEDSVDFEEMRTLLEDGFDATTESQQAAIETTIELLEDGGEAYDEMADGYLEFVDTTFDAYLDAHEQVETQYERTAADVEAVTEEFDVSA